jgi:hypothetical protein
MIEAIDGSTVRWNGERSKSPLGPAKCTPWFPAGTVSDVVLLHSSSGPCTLRCICPRGKKAESRARKWTSTLYLGRFASSYRASIANMKARFMLKAAGIGVPSECGAKELGVLGSTPCSHVVGTERLYELQRTKPDITLVLRESGVGSPLKWRVEKMGKEEMCCFPWERP